jgi:molybdenum cofactor cytidylyltransferase
MNKTVSGVILAAGPSTRFGSDLPKQLAKISGESLVSRVVGRAQSSRLSEVIVVVGYEAARVRAAIGEQPVSVIENRAFAEGQSTSVRAGLTRVDARAAAVMFLPVDQPDLSVAVIDALIEVYLHTSGAIVVPSYRGERGAPVLIDRSLFAELEVLEGDAGGRQIFSRHEDQIIDLPLTTADPLRDVDRLEDLTRYSG